MSATTQTIHAKIDLAFMAATKPSLTELIPVGISSCLLGERVRYDGGHKKNETLLRDFPPDFEFQSFCPEVSIGLGVPRNPIHLLRIRNGDIRCVDIEDSSKDYTDRLEACCVQQRAWHKTLCGYVFKKDSPSCGVTEVKVTHGEQQVCEGRGIYVSKLMEEFPYLPVAEEVELAEDLLRENFLLRVLALYHWKKMDTVGITVSRFEGFHSSHSLRLLTGSKNNYQKLDAMMATVTQENLTLIAEKYLVEFMAMLKLLPRQEA